MARPLEPAWRLLHSVVLRQLHRARCRLHGAHHADVPFTPKKTAPRDIVREVRKRLQARLEYEYARACHAATYTRVRGAMASFHSHWVATGFAVLRKGGPRLTLFTTRPACQPAPPGAPVRRRWCAWGGACGAAARVAGRSWESAAGERVHR